MLSRTVLVLIPVAIIVTILSLFHASGFESWVTPNSSVEAGSLNILFNISVNNTNSTINITQVNITLPLGFVFIGGSNQTSAWNTTFQNGSSLVWSNLTQEGLVANLTQEWFAFNASVNSTPGDYNLTVEVMNMLNEANVSILNIQVNDTTPPAGISFLSPTPGNSSWTNQSWFEVNLTFQELNPHTCLLGLNNGTTQNWTMTRSGTSCWFNASNQSQGALNWSVWINDTSGNLEWNRTWFLNIGPVPHGMTPVDPTPQNSSVTNNDWFAVNFTFIEQDPETCLLVLDNSTLHNLNMSINYTEGFCYLNVTGQGEGHLNYSLWMNNTQGAPNQSQTYYLTVDLTPTNITNITVDAGHYSANISWETSYPADSLVLYGTGNPSNLSMNITNSSLDVNHSFSLENLSVNTEYFYNITSCDNLSVCITSGTWNFTTICTEDWSYGDWGDCVNGWQYRSATDLNSCGTTDNRSITSQECDDGGSSGGGGGGSSDVCPTATKVWSNIMPGSPAVMEINLPGISARSVTIRVSERVSTSNMIVKGFQSRPSEISEPPPGTVHSYMNITTTINRSRLSSAVVEFSVESSWAELNGIDTGTVRLMRLEDNWTEMPTSFLGYENDSIIFRASVPGFSWFAISGIPAQTDVNDTMQEEPPEQQPSEDKTKSQEEAPDVTGEVCTPGENKCFSGIILQTCNPSGTGWLNQHTCIYGCRDGECSSTLVIELDYNQLWLAVAIAIILLAVAIVYMKRREIDDFLFWRL